MSDDVFSRFYQAINDDEEVASETFTRKNLRIVETLSVGDAQVLFVYRLNLSQGSEIMVMDEDKELSVHLGREAASKLPTAFVGFQWTTSVELAKMLIHLMKPQEKTLMKLVTKDLPSWKLEILDS